MLEMPEAAVIARQLNETVRDKRIINVIAAKHPHKFAFYFGDPQKYYDLLVDNVINKASSFGGLVEINAGKAIVLLGDGVNLRYYDDGKKIPDKHQLLIELEDNVYLIGSVQMYGGLWAFHQGENDNKYYLIAKEKPSPLTDGFNEDYFNNVFEGSSDKLSLKAFLATEQRIPGLGNGVLHDILFNAGLHPKRKLASLSRKDKEILFLSIRNTLREIAEHGGRDTERDLYGNPGGYKTALSKNTVNKPCIRCGGEIKKEAYLGGSIYYCGGCQVV